MINEINILIHFVKCKYIINYRYTRKRTWRPGCLEMIDTLSQSILMQLMKASLLRIPLLLNTDTLTCRSISSLDASYHGPIISKIVKWTDWLSTGMYKSSMEPDKNWSNDHCANILFNRMTIWSLLLLHRMSTRVTLCFLPLYYYQVKAVCCLVLFYV